MKQWIFVTGAIIVLAVLGIGLFMMNPKPPGETVDGQVSGATLYAENCERCHGPLATSEKRGVSAAQIQEGIAEKNAMKGLSNLTISQIQEIAKALSSP